MKKDMERAKQLEKQMKDKELQEEKIQDATVGFKLWLEKKEHER